ncbi:MAG: lipid-A-disaccharide synthase N-terminal domain-containing protein [Thermodesulfobacteriota bacterium]
MDIGSSQRGIGPLTFWYLGLCGSTLLLLYAIHRRDPVFILGRRTLRLMPQNLLISNMAGGGHVVFSHLQRV